MAYTINLTNGSIFATIPDGTINSDSSLVLIGRNYSGYGEYVAENFVRVLENHANPTAPSNPLIGQLWYSSNSGNLNLYDGLSWKTLGTTQSSASEPASQVVGDIWYDISTGQIKVYNGTSYDLIGPIYTTATGVTGPVVTTIQDTGLNDHIVTMLYVEDEIVGIISKDAPWTPLAAIPGFTTDINPGIQLADSVNGETPIFRGTAYNANLLDTLDSTQFLRSDANDVTTGSLGVNNDTGLTVGIDADIKLSVDAGGSYITNTLNNGNLFIRATPGGTATDVITVHGSSARARVNTPLNGLDIANKDYADLKVAKTGSTMTGDLILASGVALQTEGGVHRITNNDGGGNFNIRIGHQYSGGEIYTANNQGAIHLVGAHEGVDPYFQIKVGNTSTTTTGGAVTFANTFTFGNDGNLSVTAAAPSAVDDLCRKDYVDLKAPLASPALTGVPTAPTASSGTNNTQIATTAFVKSQVSYEGKIVDSTSNSSVAVPAGINRVEISLIGGGGGGSSGGDGGDYNGVSGNAGGYSRVYLPWHGWQYAYGGKGGIVPGSSQNYYPEVTGDGLTIYGSRQLYGGNPCRGGDGAGSILGGRGGKGSTSGTTAQSGTWGGGGAGGWGQDNIAGAGGASGMFWTRVFSVAEGHTIQWQLGGGGSGGVWGSRNGGNGGSGRIIIRFGKS